LPAPFCEKIQEGPNCNATTQTTLPPPTPGPNNPPNLPQNKFPQSQAPKKKKNPPPLSHCGGGNPPPPKANPPANTTELEKKTSEGDQGETGVGWHLTPREKKGFLLWESIGTRANPPLGGSERKNTRKNPRREPQPKTIDPTLKRAHPENAKPRPTA